jgi:ApaG protein
MAGYDHEEYDDGGEMMDLPGELYSTMTREIRISVEPIYLDDQSSPDESHFMWAYRVQIENTGEDAVQLRTRYWRILDSLGRVQEVRGVGVVGQQPVIHPGEVFEYTSGTPLSTPSGIMMGNYQMEIDDGETFDVDIPVFSLDSPHEQRKVH